MRRLAALGLAALLIVPPCSLAQAPGSPRRIGFLSFGSEQGSEPYVRELRRGLRDRGYVEGKNVVIVSRYAGGSAEKLPEMASDLVAQRVDLLFAGGDQNVSALKQATQSIPIVMVACDALAAGLVTNLARPGGNITGVTCINGDLAAKRLELARELFQASKTMGVILNPDDARMGTEYSRTEAAGRMLGVSVRQLPVRTLQDFVPAFKEASQRRADGAIVVFDQMTFLHRKRFAEEALASKLPTIFNFREYVDAGGLISYGPNLAFMWRQATGHIDRVFKGAKPGELPVEQPTKFELVINLRTAKSLGVTVPESLRLRADALIE